MTREIFIKLIDNKLYLEIFFISVSCIIDMFISFKFGFLILKGKVGFREILPVALAMALFNFFFHQYLPFSIFIIAQVILVTLLLVTAGKVKVLQGVWTSLMIIVSNFLGTIIISPLFFISPNIMNFLLNTPGGYIIGPLIEALIPMIGIVLLTRKPDISLIPPIISKRIDFFDVLGLITYGAMAFLLFFSSIQLYDSLKNGSRDTLINMIIYFSAAVIIIGGHISIVNALKKRFDNQIFKLEEEKAELEKREIDLQQKIAEFERIETEFQQEKEELVTEVAKLRAELQGLLPANTGEEIPLHKIQDTVFDIKIKMDELDRICNSMAKKQKRETLPITGELPPCDLTSRERKFLKGLCQGMQYKEIAPSLGLEAKTVTNMASDLLKKLGLKNNKELVKYAVEHGLDKE